MLVSRVLDQRKRASLRKLHRRALMARKRDAQGAASSPARRDQDRSNMRSSRTSRAASSSREGSVSQSGRAMRGGRSASEGRPSRTSGNVSSSRSSRSQESSVRSRRDAQRGSQARTSARPSRREPEIDPAQESRDAARQRLQARTAATLDSFRRRSAFICAPCSCRYAYAHGQAYCGIKR